MACQQLGSPDDQVRELTEKLRRFTDFALAHEAFEAMLLDDDSPWFDEMPEEIHQKFEEVQALRNRALGL